MTGMLRVLTRFRGPLLRAEHDSARGEARDEATGETIRSGLAEWLRACCRQARLHRLLGLDYRVSQEIDHNGEDHGRRGERGPG